MFYLLLRRELRTIKLSSISETISVISAPFRSSSPRAWRRKNVVKISRWHSTIKRISDSFGQMASHQYLVRKFGSYLEIWKSQILSTPVSNNLLQLSLNILFLHGWDADVLLNKSISVIFISTTRISVISRARLPFALTSTFLLAERLTFLTLLQNRTMWTALNQEWRKSRTRTNVMATSSVGLLHTSMSSLWGRRSASIMFLKAKVSDSRSKVCPVHLAILSQWRSFMALFAISSNRGQLSLKSLIFLLRALNASHSLRAFGSLRHLQENYTQDSNVNHETKEFYLVTSG